MTRALKLPPSFAYTRDQLLAQQAWWPQLSAPLRAELLAGARERSLVAGEVLGHANEPQRQWYGVLEGLLTWSVGRADGQTATLGGQLPGSWFGEATLLLGKPRMGQVAAARASRVLVLDESLFHRLRHAEPVFNEWLLSHLVARIDWMMRNSVAHRLLDTEGLVAQSLMALTHPLNNPCQDFFLCLSREELANLVTVSRQSCNKALASLQRRGFVRMEYGGIAVVDVEGLRRMTAFALV